MENSEPVLPSNDYNYPLLTDIVGSTKFKKDLEHILSNILYPQLYSNSGVKTEKSFLFNGDPGTGKTFSVQALRNEVIKSGRECAFLEYSIGSFGTAYINMGSVTMQQFFDVGHKLTEDGNIVLYFFDEADAIMGQRGDRHASKEDDKLLETLMTNLQRLHSTGKNQYAFFATNFKERMDKASIRAGRVDRILTFELPDKNALQQAYNHYIGKIRKQAKYDVFSGLSTIEQVVAQSEGLCYPDVETIVEESVRRAIYDSIESVDTVVKAPVVTESTMLHVLREHRGSRKENAKTRIGY